MPQLNFIVTQPDVSIVIGNKGVQVKALEEETNTKIHLQNDTRMLSRDFSKLRNFRIIGDKKDIVKGLIKILSETLAKEHDSPFLQCLLLPGGETQFSLQQGSTDYNKFTQEIAKLNETTSSRIRPISLGPNEMLGIEVLSISEKDMEEALGMIMELYESAGVMRETEADTTSRKEMFRLVKASIDEQMEFLKSKEIIAFLIPEEKTSFLIGPRGATIKELESAHDVKLVVEKPQAPFFATGRAVIVRGEVPNICECLAAAMDKIFEKDNIEPRVVCLIPPGVPRYLIGHAGESIRRIENESGCSLTIQPAQLRSGFPMDGQEIKYCQIKGPRENIIKGIQGVVARVILQLFLQGQTSADAIPEHSDFGVFGNFGRAIESKGPSFGRQMAPGRGRFAAGAQASRFQGRPELVPGQDWSTSMRMGASQGMWGANGGAPGPRYGGASGGGASGAWYPRSGVGNAIGTRWSPGVGANGARDGYGATRGMRQPQNPHY